VNPEIIPLRNGQQTTDMVPLLGIAFMELPGSLANPIIRERLASFSLLFGQKTVFNE
jgi:hypothetical protein